MKLAVIGSGYVGLVAAACFAELGHEVTCVDNDLRKIEALQNGEVPIHEKFLPELLARHAGERLNFSSSLPEAVGGSEVIFIAVGTPASDDGECDLSCVEAVSREIAHALDSYKIVVEKSTVPACTSEWIRRIMVLNGAPENLFEVASNPEFLREGTAVTDFLFPDRIVIGANSRRVAQVLNQLYQPLTSGEYSRSKNAIPSQDQVRIPTRLIVTSTRSAELIKHASNAFLAMKISFINAVANLSESVGANVEQVCEGIGTDSRIGEKFLRPGIGYGGSCFPKDLKAFRAVARNHGQDFGLLDEVIRINDEQCFRFLRKVRNALWTLKEKRIALLGLAFKGGTDDIRESPALTIARLLLREGCELAVYDPAAMDRAREALPAQVRYAENAYDAAEDADALLILTDWEEFGALDLRKLQESLRYPIVVDGRNLYRPEEMSAAGFMYYSIGRPEVFPKRAQLRSALRKAS